MLTQRNNNSDFVNTSAALYSRPIRPLNFGHVHAIELCCIRCKKLAWEKTCTRTVTDVQVSRASRLVEDSCTSFLTVWHRLYTVSSPHWSLITLNDKHEQQQQQTTNHTADTCPITNFTEVWRDVCQQQEAQLPLSNRASAMHFVVARLLSAIITDT